MKFINVKPVQLTQAWKRGEPSLFAADAQWVERASAKSEGRMRRSERRGKEIRNDGGTTKYTKYTKIFLSDGLTLFGFRFRVFRVFRGWSIRILLQKRARC